MATIHGMLAAHKAINSGELRALFVELEPVCLDKMILNMSKVYSMACMHPESLNLKCGRRLQIWHTVSLPLLKRLEARTGSFGLGAHGRDSAKPISVISAYSPSTSTPLHALKEPPKVRRTCWVL